MRAVFKGSSQVWATPRGRRMMIAPGILALIMAFAMVAAAGRHTLHMGTNLATPLCMIALCMLPIVWSSTITVSIEGVNVTWLGDRRFIPMAQIASVKRTSPREIELTAHDGSTFMVFTRARRTRAGSDEILDAIRSALDAYRSTGPRIDLSSAVARGRRSNELWLGDLEKMRASLGGGAAYRDAPMRSEDLLRLVEDATASDDARAGAAAVLRNALDDAGKERVRVAAESAVSPKLRIALEAKDDAALGEALDDLAAEQEAERAAKAR